MSLIVLHPDRYIPNSAFSISLAFVIVIRIFFVTAPSFGIHLCICRNGGIGVFEIVCSFRIHSCRRMLPVPNPAHLKHTKRYANLDNANRLNFGAYPYFIVFLPFSEYVGKLWTNLVESNWLNVGMSGLRVKYGGEKLAEEMFCLLSVTKYLKSDCKKSSEFMWKDY